MEKTTDDKKEVKPKKFDIKLSAGKVLFEPIKRKTQLILEGTKESKYHPGQGKVLSVGENNNPFAKVGDHIYYNAHAVDPVELYRDEPLYIIDDSAILAILS